MRTKLSNTKTSYNLTVHRIFGSLGEPLRILRNHIGLFDPFGENSYLQVMSSSNGSANPPFRSNPMQFRQASITDQPGVAPNPSFPSPPLSFQNHGASSLSAPHFAGSIAESHPRGAGQIVDAQGSEIPEGVTVPLSLIHI